MHEQGDGLFWIGIGCGIGSLALSLGYLLFLINSAN
jgi:hypothetical protein